MVTYNLHRWSVVSDNNPFMAPEMIKMSLAGYRDKEERRVITSRVVSVNGREITTKTGSVYILEDIDPVYLKWMEDNNIKYDPDNPIKIKAVK